MWAELEEAQLIQRQLLPERDVMHPAFSICGTCLLCRTVAGDWYDYILLRDGRIAVVLAGLPVTAKSVERTAEATGNRGSRRQVHAP